MFDACTSRDQAKKWKSAHVILTSFCSGLNIFKENANCCVAYYTFFFKEHMYYTLNWEITPLKFLLQYSIHKWGGKFKWIRKLWWLGGVSVHFIVFFYCYWYSFCLLSKSMNWSIFPSFLKKTIQIAQRTKQRLKNSAERIKECGRLNIWF